MRSRMLVFLILSAAVYLLLFYLKGRIEKRRIKRVVSIFIYVILALYIFVFITSFLDYFFKFG